MRDEPWSPEWRGSRLQVLAEDWVECTRCDLHETRSNVVFGRGAVSASILFVGEGPGENEDAEGVPWVGDAGLLLDDMLDDSGIPEEETFLTNLVGCLPPKHGNQRADPNPTQVKSCWPRLYEIIYIIDPLLVIPVGKVAMKALMKKDPLHEWNSIVSNHGALGRIKIPAKELPFTLEYPAMPILHPAYILRKDAQHPRTGAWRPGGEYTQTVQDLLRAKRIVDELYNAREEVRARFEER